MKRASMRVLIMLILILTVNSSHAFFDINLNKVGECYNLGTDPWSIYVKSSPDKYGIKTPWGKQGVLFTEKKNMFDGPGTLNAFWPESHARLTKVMKLKNRSGFKVDTYIFEEDPTCMKK